MSQLVPKDRIEKIVGAKRHQREHYGRAVTAEQTVYILHSADCAAQSPDLRRCEYSLALDQGIDVDDWIEDEPVMLAIVNGRLIGDISVGTSARGEA